MNNQKPEFTFDTGRVKVQFHIENMVKTRDSKRGITHPEEVMISCQVTEDLGHRDEEYAGIVASPQQTKDFLLWAANFAKEIYG